MIIVRNEIQLTTRCSLQLEMPDESDNFLNLKLFSSASRKFSFQLFFYRLIYDISLRYLIAFTEGKWCHRKNSRLRKKFSFMSQVVVSYENEHSRNHQSEDNKEKRRIHFHIIFMKGKFARKWVKRFHVDTWIFKIFIFPSHWSAQLDARERLSHPIFL